MVHSNQDDNAKKYKAKRYYLPKGIIKIYGIIINLKNFYDHPIDSDIKRYEEIVVNNRKKVKIIQQGVC